MDAANPKKPKLTENDKKVLKSIIQQPKCSDTEIAGNINLTQQAVFKIRHKLEKQGIIEGYMPIINYKKIGINVMAIVSIRVRHKIWLEMTDDQISEKIKNLASVFAAYRIPKSNVTHVLILGFRDIEQQERQLMRLQTKFRDEIEVIRIYPFSVSRIITQNPMTLLFEIIDKKEMRLKSLFYGEK